MGHEGKTPGDVYSPQVAQRNEEEVFEKAINSEKAYYQYSNVTIMWHRIMCSKAFQDQATATVRVILRY